MPVTGWVPGLNVARWHQAQMQIRRIQSSLATTCRCPISTPGELRCVMPAAITGQTAPDRIGVQGGERTNVLPQNNKKAVTSATA